MRNAKPGGWIVEILCRKVSVDAMAVDLHQSISMNYPTLEFSRLLPAGTLLHLDLSILRSGRCAISSIRRKSAGSPAKHPPRSQGLCLCTLECRAHAIWNLQILQDPCGRYRDRSHSDPGHKGTARARQGHGKGPRAQGHQGTRAQGHKDTEAQGHKGTRARSSTSRK